MADLPFRRNIGHLRQDGGGRSVPVMRIETMGLFTKDIKTMDDLFVHQLRTFVTPRNNS